jgi:hypothetical protein
LHANGPGFALLALEELRPKSNVNSDGSPVQESTAFV